MASKCVSVLCLLSVQYANLMSCSPVAVITRPFCAHTMSTLWPLLLLSLTLKSVLKRTMCFTAGNKEDVFLFVFYLLKFLGVALWSQSVLWQHHSFSDHCKHLPGLKVEHFLDGAVHTEEHACFPMLVHTVYITCKACFRSVVLKRGEGRGSGSCSSGSIK